MSIPQPGPLWRRTPPAVFPPIMGLFGVGLGWRRAEDALGVPPSVPDLIIGAVSLLFIFFAASYAVKLVVRPRVLIEDIRVLPGLAGLSAMTLSAMLMAAGLARLAPLVTTILLLAALTVHTILVFVVLWRIATGPAEGRSATPVWHLTFVGFIIAPLAAIPLGHDAIALICFIGTMPVAAFIYLVNAVQLLRRPVPAPLRPLQAIHLAPVSVFGAVAALMGYDGLALCFALAATAVAAILLGRVRYLTAAGFSPLWGAFTFPMAAYASVLLLLAGLGDGVALAGGLVLAAATVAVPVIALRVLRAWATGALAARTNAAAA